MQVERPKVLAVADYFLPGFHGGGPIRTLANLRRSLKDQITIDLFTRDRDLGMSAPYPDIPVNKWVDDDDGRLFYADPEHFGPTGLSAAAASTHYDILYLNSFFSLRGSILMNFAMRKKANRPRVIIAPRGEFSPGALALKQTKKRLFLATVKAIGLYRDVDWHVSTPTEKSDLLRVFPNAEQRVHIAVDPVEGVEESHAFPTKTTGALNLVFISRISPMKNLDGLLRILSQVRRQVTLSIYGPIEDQHYWNRCKAIIATLPQQIKVAHKGAVNPDQIGAVFASHDIFAFPTHGENFGHVIFESIRAGTPVLLSDQTSWVEDGSDAIKTIPLSKLSHWRDAIEAASDRSDAEQMAARLKTLDYARRYADSAPGSADTLAMFRSVTASS